MEADSLERAALAHAPPGSVIVGASVSPDGRHGAAVTLLPSARGYVMDDVFELVGDGWELHSGGSAGLSWTSIGDGPTGVLRYTGGAPAGVRTACVTYEGQEYRADVRHGHFVLVVWDTAHGEDPDVARFE